MCVKEFVKYELGTRSKGFCSANFESSCERALCECDQQFAQEHAQAANQNIFNNDYHIFYNRSPEGWEPEVLFYYIFFGTFYKGYLVIFDFILYSKITK